MMQFKEIKNALFREKKRLEIIIENQKELLELLKPMDGKMYNVRIPEYIKKNSKFRAYIWGERKELSVHLVGLESMLPKKEQYRPYNGNEDYVFCELKKAITDDDEKRFSYPKFRQKMLERIARNRAELSAVEADIIEGADRLREMSAAMSYYEEMAGRFSSFIRHEFHKRY